MPVDILAFGPHPDDAEIGAGATLLKMKQLGYSTGIIDLTTGDMGLGTPAIRAEESRRAAEILKLDVRENLDLGDWRVADTFENQCKAAAMIRRHRPTIVLAPWYDLPITRGLGHNDHYKGGQIVANAYNLAHLRKPPIEGEPHQAKAIFFYFLPPGSLPTFVVDVSDTIEAAIRAVECHESQFNNPERPRPAHLPSLPDRLRSFSQYWGWHVGAHYGQAFMANSSLRVTDMLDLVKDVAPRPV
jgi:bacillithiol biosynthesis deacetylase BshB1